MSIIVLICVAVLFVFVLAIFHGNHQYEPMDGDDSQKLDETKEVLKEKSNWFF